MITIHSLNQKCSSWPKCTIQISNKNLETSWWKMMCAQLISLYRISLAFWVSHNHKMQSNPKSLLCIRLRWNCLKAPQKVILKSMLCIRKILSKIQISIWRWKSKLLKTTRYKLGMPLNRRLITWVSTRKRWRRRYTLISALETRTHMALVQISFQHLNRLGWADTPPSIPHRRQTKSSSCLSTCPGTWFREKHSQSWMICIK